MPFEAGGGGNKQRKIARAEAKRGGEKAGEPVVRTGKVDTRTHRPRGSAPAEGGCWARPPAW